MGDEMNVECVRITRSRVNSRLAVNGGAVISTPTRPSSRLSLTQPNDVEKVSTPKRRRSLTATTAPVRRSRRLSRCSESEATDTEADLDGIKEMEQVHAKMEKVDDSDATARRTPMRDIKTKPVVKLEAIEELKMETIAENQPVKHESTNADVTMKQANNTVGKVVRVSLEKLTTIDRIAENDRSQSFIHVTNATIERQTSAEQMDVDDGQFIADASVNEPEKSPEKNQIQKKSSNLSPLKDSETKTLENPERNEIGNSSRASPLKVSGRSAMNMDTPETFVDDKTPVKNVNVENSKDWSPLDASGSPAMVIDTPETFVDNKTPVKNVNVENPKDLSPLKASGSPAMVIDTPETFVDDKTPVKNVEIKNKSDLSPLNASGTPEMIIDTPEKSSDEKTPEKNDQIKNPTPTSAMKINTSETFVDDKSPVKNVPVGNASPLNASETSKTPEHSLKDQTSVKSGTDPDTSAIQSPDKSFKLSTEYTPVTSSLEKSLESMSSSDKENKSRVNLDMSFAKTALNVNVDEVRNSPKSSPKLTHLTPMKMKLRSFSQSPVLNDDTTFFQANESGVNEKSVTSTTERLETPEKSRDDAETVKSCEKDETDAKTVDEIIDVDDGKSDESNGGFVDELANRSQPRTVSSDSDLSGYALNESSKSSKKTQFIDDEAFEVSDTDTPSTDSNEIVDLGESIGSKDTRSDDDEYIEDDGFVVDDDDDESNELLSGTGDDLSDGETKTTVSDGLRTFLMEDSSEEDGNVAKDAKLSKQLEYSDEEKSAEEEKGVSLEGESVDKSLGKSVDKSLDKSMNKSLNKSSVKSLDESLNKSLDKSMNKSLNKSLNKSSQSTTPNKPDANDDAIEIVQIDDASDSDEANEIIGEYDAILKRLNEKQSSDAVEVVQIDPTDESDRSESSDNQITVTQSDDGDSSTSEKSPVEELPVKKSPVKKSPVKKSPVTKSSVTPMNPTPNKYAKNATLTLTKFDFDRFPVADIGKRLIVNDDDDDAENDNDDDAGSDDAASDNNDDDEVAIESSVDENELEVMEKPVNKKKMSKLEKRESNKKNKKNKKPVDNERVKEKVAIVQKKTNKSKSNVKPQSNATKSKPKPTKPEKVGKSTWTKLEPVVSTVAFEMSEIKKRKHDEHACKPSKRAKLNGKLTTNGFQVERNASDVAVSKRGATRMPDARVKRQASVELLNCYKKVKYTR